MAQSLASTGSSTRVYYVNGPASTSTPLTSSWTSSNAKKRRKKGKLDPLESTSGVRLVQDLEFPEASYRVRTTRDGRYLVATGAYKPRMKVWDLHELSTKFERVTDAENVDFTILSDDWTKSIHLQNDRSIEFHNQAQAYYRTRIPRFGRTIAYHYPSCDTLAGGDGGEIYRLNLEQGRFLNPFRLEGNQDGSDSANAGENDVDVVTGVNAIDINPAHQLLSFGTETELGKGSIELWDPRARHRVGILRLPFNNLITPSHASSDPTITATNTTPLSVTALSSRHDGLTMAVGTSSGHALLYDIRQMKPYNTKDQGYGLPVKAIRWPFAPSADNSDDLVATVDSKILKIWDRNSSENFVSINPPSMINDVHFYPNSGLVFFANEDTPMTSFYIPDLGPAPKWARFLDNMTEEMEQDQAGVTVYEDYKFVDKPEIYSLGLDHLIGSPQLKPYMHGYFIDLRLYTKARAIANPFAYNEYREKQLAERMEKERESRIRSVNNNNKTSNNRKVSKEDEHDVLVNKKMAERLRAKEEKENKKKQRKNDIVDNIVEGEESKREQEPQSQRSDEKEKNSSSTSLLRDERFKAVFTDPEFTVDETSREYALVNPSAHANAMKTKMSRVGDSDSSADEAGEEEEEEEEEEEIEEEEDDEEDEEVDEEVEEVDERLGGTKSKPARSLQEEEEPGITTTKNLKFSKGKNGKRLLVEDPDDNSSNQNTNNKMKNIHDVSKKGNQRKTIGQLASSSSTPLSKLTSTNKKVERKDRNNEKEEEEEEEEEREKEFTFIPSGKSNVQERKEEKKQRKEMLSEKQKQDLVDKKAKKDQFGAGLQKGSSIGDVGSNAFAGDAGRGRQRKRHPGRSASKTVMRGIK